MASSQENGGVPNPSVEFTDAKKKSVKGSKYHCCVPLCGGDSRYDSSLSFHRFPKETKANTAVRKQWLAKIQRKIGKTFQISSATRVCSRHFRKEDFKPATHQTVHISKEEPFHPFLSGQYNSLKPGEALFVMYKLSR
ncbi:hypothetical protein QZH41_010796 [Actinostola sp. cb2023]|nr:hypothetical protein QZH41_010796 [Actinostola sp. cb2023]